MRRRRRLETGLGHAAFRLAAQILNGQETLIKVSGMSSGWLSEVGGVDKPPRPEPKRRKAI